MNPIQNGTDSEPSDKENQRQVEHAYSFLETHGQLSFEQLQAMAASGGSEDIEQLHQLADDHDIPYEEATDLGMLAEQIYRAMTEGDNSGISA